MRIQGIEIEDLKGYPGILRSLQTDYLRFISSLFGVYKPGINLASKIIQEKNIVKVYDIGSGGGGAIPNLIEDLKSKNIKIPEITLTDLYPNQNAAKIIEESSEGKAHYDLRSLNALDVIKEISNDQSTLVTVFNMFHHLDEPAAQKFLAVAKEKELNLLIVEPLDKSVFQILINILVTLILSPILNLFILPVRLSRFIFSYLIPIVPVVTCFDGIFSVLRLYSVSHLNQITPKGNNYLWEAGKLKFTFGKTIYLKGEPL
ncbi:hypothetical protein [Marinigracilibium pacificum]|uniref:Methyltransferase family protein n=1 Tax=Marinigracilibium pacificum TaxID=2729599 RepID=A0A848IXY3_9BACT|nr:hypothetical protein [Marinigracilibium pacificum]NMM47104.1 hypothetical protein [Marinigracilibium pacificum]